MSSEAVVAAPAATGELGKVRHAQRLALAIALPFLLGEALDFAIPFLGSVLALQLLAPRGAPPKPKAAVAGVLALGVALAFAWVLAHLAPAHPLPFLLLTGVVVFGALHAGARTGSPFWFIVLIAVLVEPLVLMQSVDLAWTFGRALMGGLALAFVVAWLAHAWFPDPDPPTARAAAAVVDSAQAIAIARTGTLVLMPLLAWMLATGSAAIVMAITSLTIVRAAGVSGGSRVALGTLVGNLIAGVLATAVYNLVEIASSYAFLVAIVLGAALIFAQRIAAGGARAPLALVACVAFLTLLGLGLTPFNDAGTAFVTRVTDVLIASAYSIAFIAFWTRSPSPDMPLTGTPAAR